MNVVVYLRTRPSEPEASEAALAAQRTAAASWLAQHQATLIAEFIQPEADGEPPRQLWQALKLCRQQSATLLIAMTDPIGSSGGFGSYTYYGHVHCVSITHTKPDPPPARPPAPPEPAEAQRPPEPVPLPDGAPDRLCLYFDTGGFPKLPVYLCHPGPGPIRDVVVTSVGITTQWTQTVTMGKGKAQRTVEVPLQTSRARQCFDVIESGTCLPVDHYDRFFDGDFITIYEVAYTDAGGTVRQGRLVIDKGGPRRRWLALAER